MFQDQEEPRGIVPGCAPEIGQHKLMKEEAERRAALEAGMAPKTIFNTEWWMMKPGEKDPIKLMGQDLQDYLNENPGDVNVCSLEGAKSGEGWTLASTKGFNITEPPQKEVVGEAGVDLAKSPEEEALETLPDEELFKLAEERMLLQRNPETGEPDRAATVKVLATAGVKVL